MTKGCCSACNNPDSSKHLIDVCVDGKIISYHNSCLDLVLTSYKWDLKAAEEVMESQTKTINLLNKESQDKGINLIYLQNRVDDFRKNETYLEMKLHPYMGGSSEYRHRIDNVLSHIHKLETLSKQYFLELMAHREYRNHNRFVKMYGDDIYEYSVDQIEITDEIRAKYDLS